MARLLVAIDSGVGVSAAEFAGEWNADRPMVGDGLAAVDSAGAGAFIPGLVELVVVPVAVNVASSVFYDAAKRIVGRLFDKSSPDRVASEVEVSEFTSASGDRVVVFRTRREIG